MRTALRNRLAELLLGSFNDLEKRIAIAWLSLFCRLAARRDPPKVSLGELLRWRGGVSPQPGGGAIRGFGHLVGPGRLLRLRLADAGDPSPGARSGGTKGGRWMVEPEPDVRADFAAVRGRVRAYAGLVARMGRIRRSGARGDPLRSALAEAALCFNAGLFFEAHEHLEHHWAAQPGGPTKRFLQGIIQISVGFHHACAGRYDGAVNQLGKGLEKTRGSTGVVLGVDCDAFLPGVAALRDAIMTRGRANMRRVAVSDIPRMPMRE